MQLPLAAQSKATKPSGAKKSVIVMGAGIAGLSLCVRTIANAATMLRCLRPAAVPAAMSGRSMIRLPMGCMPTSGASTSTIRDTRTIGAIFTSSDSPLSLLAGETIWSISCAENDFSEKDLHSRRVLKKLGFNQREIDFS